MTSFYCATNDHSTMVYQRQNKGEDGYFIGDNCVLCFDGHSNSNEGAKTAVRLCCQHFPVFLKQNLENCKNPLEAINKTFLDMDQILFDAEYYSGGSTVCGYCIVNGKIYLFWLGDSEIFLKMKDGHVCRLTEGRQHNTDNRNEMARIWRDFDKLGFHETHKDRIRGGTNITRGLGDFQAKKGSDIYPPHFYYGHPNKESLKICMSNHGSYVYDANVMENEPEIEVYELHEIRSILLCSDGLIDHIDEQLLKYPFDYYNNKQNVLSYYDQNLRPSADGYMDDVTCIISDLAFDWTPEPTLMTLFHLPDTPKNREFMITKLHAINPNLPAWVSQYAISGVTFKDGIDWLLTYDISFPDYIPNSKQR